MMKKQRRGPTFAPDTPARELRTVRDFLRFAVSHFNDSGLDFGHGTDNALDEAAFLILEALNLPPDVLEPWLDCTLTAAERRTLGQLIHRRIATRKPAPYLLGRAYIQDYKFFIDERVIVPRSFIGEILLRADSPAGGLKDVHSILDLCTGSGCLAIIAADLFPQAVVDAVDLSADAIAVARDNVRYYGFEERVTLHHGDLFMPVAGNKYDLIITNPPYVDTDGMGALGAEYRHEPEMALYGGADGMDLVRTIIRQAHSHLNPGGALICEVGRGKPVIDAQFPALPLQWLATENSDGEVFWTTAADLAAARAAA